MLENSMLPISEDAIFEIAHEEANGPFSSITVMGGKLVTWSFWCLISKPGTPVDWTYFRENRKNFSVNRYIVTEK